MSDAPRWAQALVAVARWLTAPVVLLILVTGALIARATTRRRKRQNAPPRLLFGPVPILNSKYIKEALVAAGFPARTVVRQTYHIHGRDDFDEVLRPPRLGAIGAVLAVWSAVLGEPLYLVRVLFRDDIVHFYFDGGFLALTPLRFLEVPLLHLAGCRVIVMPYGSDVAVPTEISSLAWRHGLNVHYPTTGRVERRTKRWIRHLSRRADFVLTCLVHCETLPRWDLLATHYYPIDTETWTPDDRAEHSSAEVVVVHAPNHRTIKGTEFVIRACHELREEGVPIRLELLEGLPNHEVRARMARADVVVEQLHLGYALTAMEGMSLGKPVVSNLSDPRYYEVFRQQCGLDACPIVSADPSSIKGVLRELAGSGELRDQLGIAGRAYCIERHSYEAVAAMWATIYDHVWAGRPLETGAWPPASPVSS